ncbi:Clp protease N-terminal domain-containing protein [Aeromicrobium sp. NPDC092404]|uniref:Clp protease N-terminal domain-containing protein n=1 Tax=Aeromicrobium sp. NPDC092404 TaxID=3154976 RepID=UPI00341513FF
MRRARALRDISTMRTLMESAERSARAGGDDLPGPEHLLLAALDLPDGTAAAALGEVGIGRRELEGAVREVHDAALTSIGVDPSSTGSAPPAPRPKVMRSTAPAQEAFNAALHLARTKPRSALVGAHVVAAVAEQQAGTAVRALDHLGVDRDRLVAVALEVAATA